MLANQPRLAAPHHPKAVPRAGRAAHDHRSGGIPEAVFQQQRAQAFGGARGALEHWVKGAPSNKRLKLTGGDRSKGTGVLCPGGHELSFDINAPCGRVARSLSAIR